MDTPPNLVLWAALGAVGGNGIGVLLKTYQAVKYVKGGYLDRGNICARKEVEITAYLLSFTPGDVHVRGFSHVSGHTVRSRPISDLRIR